MTYPNGRLIDRTEVIMSALCIDLLRHTQSDFNRAKFQLQNRAFADLRLRSTAKLVLAHIVAHTFPQQGFYHPKTATLAAALRVSEQSIRKATKSLVEASYLFCDRQSGPNQTNRYFLNLSGKRFDAESIISPSLIWGNNGESWLSPLERGLRSVRRP